MPIDDQRPSQPGATPDLWAERPGQSEPRAGKGEAATSAKAPKNTLGDPAWERSTLEKLLFASLKEQRAARRWRIFFRFVFFGYFVFLAWLLAVGSNAGSLGETSEHVAVVQIKGTIADGEEASAQYIIPSLREAFKNDHAKAVILQINSPGGSPVQAGLINDEINRLKGLHKKPVYAVIGETGASAAYYIAVAADDIYVNKASIVGSIGVLMNGFGFTGTMEKLGVERRLITSGANKGFMDPFSPLKPEDVEHAKAMADQVHQQFIDVVRAGRGDRIKENKDTYSGMFWIGQESIVLGLADGLGSVSSVARDQVKVDTLVDYSRKKNLADQLANKLGASIVNNLGLKDSVQFN